MNSAHSFTEGMDWPQRHDNLTTEQAIDILFRDEVIYWTEKGYRDEVDVDWKMVAIFFNTNEIHTFNQGYKTRIYF